ncbi:Na+/H+ antiporter subunit E [filamentous cyanobacterium LEGE 11480]|uniref:Na+/H+ antiporter subunit E n=1 Tax=Romeriopsis navalis LEGE 11480 TaxID=2777977 RepID=A0A928VKB2_9CYAN|nr:Na+/H+ antiporter subunit E [Romeriopsis navalis]MBE9029217.1 Na+/H+ antiporter subunit E [Romeriopsis navalis LEGE 11480]
MIGDLEILLRLAIWLLLTSDLSLENLAIGVAVSVILPHSAIAPVVIRDWLRAIGEVLIAIPQAYVEAIEIMLWPHKWETVSMERVKPRRTPGLIFLDIFIITFTPKTIVLKYHDDGWYEVHRVQRRRSV